MNEKEPSGKRILLVDDSKDILSVISKRIESWGYKAVTAESGERALELLSSDPLPDLILLDIMMPKMKGREVCERLKADPRTADIPIIFLTALGLADHVKAGMELGADDYIIKPFEPAVLKERISVCLLRREREKGKA